MDYIPKHAVWEITYACNMRCKHCGSSCGEKYPNELTLEEALLLCDDLAELGLEIMTLSGGEPLLHKDWDKITKRLVDNGVTTNIISNGWYIDEEIIDRAFAAGLANFGLSIDGLKETHDFIRKQGSFDRVMNALDLLKQKKMPVSVNTSVNKLNLPELDALTDILVEKKVVKWQFQIASPMGNLLDHPDMIIGPEEIDDIINFIYKTMIEKRIIPYMADDIGYYNRKEMASRSTCYYGRYSLCEWGGCHAGKKNIGIRANGDISGCLSIRDNNYIEDNIRNTPLKEIWTKPGAFEWNRNYSKENLEGFCRTCQYAEKCLGGCTGLKLTFSKTLNDNTYCSYRVMAEKAMEMAGALNNYDELVIAGKKYLDQAYYHIAEVYLLKAHTLKPDNNLNDLLSFVYFSLNNYKTSMEYTEVSLRHNPKNPYAYKVRGLCLDRMGKTIEGILHLKRAIKYADTNYSDIYINLALMMHRTNNTKGAIKILAKGRKRSEECRIATEKLFQSLQQQLQQQKMRPLPENYEFIPIDTVKK